MIPKSLHTVTVLVAVAKLFIRTTGTSNKAAVYMAASELGYSIMPADSDPYGLLDKARAQLDKVRA